MCRALVYLGPSVALDELLYRPDSALVRQSIDPKYLHMLNLAGFGMASWNRRDAIPEEPLSYMSTTVPGFDQNLASLSQKLSTTTLLAHVRGISYRHDSGHGAQNLHPFRYSGYRIALAHNGDLSKFSTMKSDLQRHLRPEIAAEMRGTTDSEWVYALLLSQLDEPKGPMSQVEILRALHQTLTILRSVRAQHGIDISSSLNLFVTDGTDVLAVRFTFDFGRYPLDKDAVHEANARYLSMWYTTGQAFMQAAPGRWQMCGDGPRPKALLLASEPLTQDTTGWVEAPEYSALYARYSDGDLVITTTEIDA